MTQRTISTAAGLEGSLVSFAQDIGKRVLSASLQSTYKKPKLPKSRAQMRFIARRNKQNGQKEILKYIEKSMGCAKIHFRRGLHAMSETNGRQITTAGAASAVRSARVIVDITTSPRIKPHQLELGQRVYGFKEEQRTLNKSFEEHKLLQNLEKPSKV